MAALDGILPTYRHRELHQQTMTAPPSAVWDALFQVTVGELPLSRFLTAIRALPRRLIRGGWGLGRGLDQPALQMFLDQGFRELRVDRPRLFVAGAAIQPWRLVSGRLADVRDLAGFSRFTQPGFVLAAVSFELEPVHNGTRLATETRIQPTDPRAARAFRMYWLAIRVGSGLIRRELLHAVSVRTETSRG